MSTLRRFSIVAPLLAFVASCSVVFVPDVNDDGVTRCDRAQNGRDCPQPEDPTIAAVCIQADSTNANVPWVCDFTEVTVKCDAKTIGTSGETHGDVWRAAYADVRKLTSVYSSDNCDAGTVGCFALEDGSCDAGTPTERDIGGEAFQICVGKNGALVPATEEVIGQDVLDQGCRAFYCDDSFVCDLGTGSGVCRKCDGEGIGEGACGQLALGGEISPVYIDVGDSCKVGVIELGDLPAG